MGKRKYPFRKERPCAKCGVDMGPGGELPRYCRPCGHEVYEIRRKALTKVHGAIARGDLPHPKTLACVDCLDQARCYDHRRYDQPLKVDPVCYSCNWKRGPAKWEAA